MNSYALAVGVVAAWTLVVGLYFGFCVGAHWARARSAREAAAKLAEARERRDGLLRDLEALGEWRKTPQQVALVDAIKRAERKLDEASAVERDAWYHESTWSTWLPWVHWLPLGERAQELRQWWRSRRALRRAAAKPEGVTPLDDDDRRMLEEIKRSVLKEGDDGR